MKRRAAFLASQSFVVLSVRIPKENDKNAQSAEQFFAALHGIYRDDPAIQEHVSFEMAAAKDSITFYVFCPIHLREFIEGQLYAQYPDLNIQHVNDYTQGVELRGKHVATTRIKLSKEDVYPIKTFLTLDVDPLAGLMAVMSSLEEGEHMWFQMVVKPVGDKWQNRGVAHVQAIRTGRRPASTTLRGLSKLGRVASMVAQEVIRPGSVAGQGLTGAEAPKLSAPQEAALKGLETKITKLGFETIFRMVTIAGTESSARSHTLAFVGALKQFNTNNLNGFEVGETKIDDFTTWEQYLNREFEERGGVLNIEELASVYHYPSSVVESNAINRVGAKKGEAPFNIPLKELVDDPKELTLLGKTDFRKKSEEFGIRMDDRKRHIYVIGKSGVGKSTLLENMIIDDINFGRGVIVVDPHGELADKVIDSIPEHRIQDAIIIDPSDLQWPISFNPLEHVGENFRGLVASGFVGVLKKIFGDSWGPRLEYILRNTTLALLESKNSTMMGIPRMLTDKVYRESVVAQITDPVVRAFWQYEWNGMEPKQQAEAIGPILNKVGQFLSSAMIRNLTCQPTSTINFRKAMDEQKILVVNLSKGKIGEDAMALLGSMIVTRVQLAAMSRADVPPSQRPDCFLYVDEFQNFATDSFANILSEARKYNLGLTIAHQYIGQLSDEVRDAVIGNVGSMILFRVGTPDAEALQKEFAPVFEVADMINLEKGHVYIKLLVDGFAAQPFSARTMMPKHVEGTLRDQVIAFSRQRYSRPRAEVEGLIDEVSGYKQKREAEDASKLASQILTQQPAPGMSSSPRQPAAQPQAHQQAREVVATPVAPVQTPAVPTPRSEAVQTVPAQAIPPKPVAVHDPKPVEVSAVTPLTQEGEGSEPKVKKPVKEKPPKILNGYVYKEVAQRGGLKWYIAETKDEYEARKAAQKAQAESPELSPQTEQEPNIISAPVQTTQTYQQPQVQSAAQPGGQTLQEGESLSL